LEVSDMILDGSPRSEKTQARIIFADEVDAIDDGLFPRCLRQSVEEFLDFLFKIPALVWHETLPH
jgi:hypothetical protein